MSYVDALREAYSRAVARPWDPRVPAGERVWMAIYPPEQERRVRFMIPEFKNATTKAGHGWATIDITTAFEEWMVGQEYRERYFEAPDLLVLPSFGDHLAVAVRKELNEKSKPDNVVALLGGGTLFGLGDKVRVSALLDDVNEAIKGRLLVFFPGRQENSNYHLLDARDGWDYRAIPISADTGDSR